VKSSEHRLRELAERQRAREHKERDKTLSEACNTYQKAHLELSLQKMEPTSDEQGEQLKESDAVGYLTWCAAKAKRARKRERNLQLKIAQDQSN